MIQLEELTIVAVVAAVVIVVGVLGWAVFARRPDIVVVGKDFTEQDILGAMQTILLREEFPELDVGSASTWAAP